MKTPIYDFVSNYSKENFLRLHMPGHKGKNFILNQNLDITEIKGADSLFEANGIISESEKNATMLFNTAKTIYSTQGSTLAIQTMLTLVTANYSRKNDEKPLIIAVRNAHKAFLNSCVLLDLDVKWIYPIYSTDSIASGDFSEIDIETAIHESNVKPSAVFLTSPDYLGKISNIKNISKVCKRHGIPLLVDNAHGAYLSFLETSLHPIALGADMCSDSAHKTLPVLTGGAYLHISKNANSDYCENAKATMALFASTSPSYLTLCSLDLCNDYLDKNMRKDLKTTITEVNELKKNLEEIGYILVKSDPLKLTINTKSKGICGHQLAEMLRNEKIECEYSDETHIVFMFSTMNNKDDVSRLWTSISMLDLSNINKNLNQTTLEFKKLEAVMSIREAAFSKSEEISVDKANGRICSKLTVACPPGIPIAVSGEIITDEIIKIFKRYSIFTVNVVKYD